MDQPGCRSSSNPSLFNATAEAEDQGHDDVLRLAQSHLKVNVLGRIAEYTYCVVFVNNFSSPVESCFTLPQLKDDATFTHISATFSSNPSEEIIATLVPKDEALPMYDDAIADGRAVAYTELNTTPDARTLSVVFGNVGPGDSISMKVRAVAEMDPSNILCVPLGDFMGKETPVSASVEVFAVDPIDALVIDGKVVSRTTNELYRMKHEWTLMHDNDHVEKQATIQVQISAAPMQGNEDTTGFDVTNVIDGNHTMTCVRYNHTTAKQDTNVSEVEYMFIADCSGSMSGDKIENLKKTLQLFLRSLESNNGTTYFNIIKFGSSCTSMSSAPLVYNETTLQEATTYVTQMDADMGGTTMKPPLVEALQNSPTPAREKRVFLLTDGLADDEDQVRSYLLGSELRTLDFRVFTVGLGNDVNVKFLQEISKDGRCDLCDESERSMRIILQQLRMTLKPCAYDVMCRGVLISSVIPAGDTMTKITDTSNEPRGKNGENIINYQPIKESGNSLFHLQFRDVRVPCGFEGCLRRLHAYQRIKELLKDGNQWEATRVSIDSGVLCDTTSFIVSSHIRGRQHPTPMKLMHAECTQLHMKQLDAVFSRMTHELHHACVKSQLITREAELLEEKMFEMEHDRLQARIELIHQQQRMFSGRGSSNTVQSMINQLRFQQEMVKQRYYERRREIHNEQAMMEHAMQDQQHMLHSMHANQTTKASLSRKAHEVYSQRLHSILTLQSFDGSWDLQGDDLRRVIEIQSSVSNDEILRVLSEATQSTMKDLKVAGTILAVLCLEQRYPTESSAWGMLVEKAMRWLQRNHNIGRSHLMTAIGPIVAAHIVLL